MDNFSPDQIEGIAAAAEKFLLEGIALYEKSDLASAMDAWSEALAVYEALIEGGHWQYRGDAAQTHTNLGGAFLLTARLTEAIAQFKAAWSGYQILVDEGQTQYRANAAGSRNNLGLALTNFEQLTEAMEHFEAALSVYQILINEGQSQYHADTAQTRMNMGTALLTDGQLSKALLHCQSALSDYKTLIDAGYTKYRANAAGTRVIMAAALSAGGKLTNALAMYQDALGDFQELVHAGHSEYRVNVASTRIELGNALSDDGQLTEATEQYQTAVADYQVLIDAGEVHHQADVARIHANLGNVFSRNGKTAEAVQEYQLALSKLLILISAGQSQYLADEAHTRMNLGCALSVIGQIPQGIEQFVAASAGYQILIDAGQSQYRADAARAHTNLGAALSDAGRLPEAMLQLQGAVRHYSALIDTGHHQYTANRALALDNLGLALSRLGHLPEAIEQHQVALADYQVLINAGQSQYHSNAINVRMNLWIALDCTGQKPEAKEQYQAALSDYRGLIAAGQRQYRADAAYACNNLGMALEEAGHSDEALEQFQFALSEFQSLIDDGKVQYRSNAAMVRMNLGIALKNLGQLAEATEQYRMALSDFQSLVDTGQDQYRADVALTRTNLGNTLNKAGQHTAAMEQHQAALSEYQMLSDVGRNQYRSQAANAHNAFGVTLEDVGEEAAAMKQYQVALSEYQILIGVGHEQYRSDVALVRMNIGTAMWRTEQILAATEQYELAILGYRSLMREGQSHHADVLINVTNLLTNAALDQALLVQRNEVDGTKHGDAEVANAVLAGALNQLADLPLQSLDPRRLWALKTTWETVQRCWFARDDLLSLLLNWTDALLPVCTTWLNHAAELLSRGRPDFLQDQFDEGIRPLLKAVLGLLLEMGRPSAVANWHLRTQGLRAQRQTIAAGKLTDPEFARLDALYSAVEQLDREILGQYKAAADRTTGYRESVSSEQETRNIQPRLRERKRLWEEELLPLERSLQSQGRLPNARHLDLAALGERIRHPLDSRTTPSRIALLLLIPVDEQSMALVCVRGGSEPGEPSYRAELHRMSLLSGETALRNIAETLTQATTNGNQRHGVVRGEVGNADERLTLAETGARSDQTPLAALQARWLTAPDILRSLLGELHSQGVDEVHIVPGGDLHLAPWAASLDHAMPELRVRQFPTTASWWRVMGEPADTPAPARWASLAFDAANTQAELIWVNAEARALQQIWSHAEDAAAPAMHPLNPLDPNWPPPDQSAAPVQALVGIGHGHAPEGNWALAGMVVGTDVDQGGKNLRYRYFTGIDLYKIQEARHIAMSCCVLGRVRDSQGEPIGMTALAFGFKTRMALGSLVPVPDFEGALFSMTVHFAWAQAEQASLARGRHLDWSGVFHETRREVMAGRWPSRFGEWLGNNLLSLAVESGDGLDDDRYVFLEADDLFASPQDRVARLVLAPPQTVRSIASMFTCLG